MAELGLIKYKTFEDARRDLFAPKFEKGFPKTGFSRYSNPYPPGLYKFKTFEEARCYDLKVRIEKSVKK